MRVTESSLLERAISSASTTSLGTRSNSGVRTEVSARKLVEGKFKATPSWAEPEDDTLLLLPLRVRARVCVRACVCGKME